MIQLGTVKSQIIEGVEGVKEALTEALIYFPEDVLKHLTGTSQIFGDKTSWKQFAQIYHSEDSKTQIVQNIFKSPLRIIGGILDTSYVLPPMIFYGIIDLVVPGHPLYRLNELTKDISYIPQFPGTSPPIQNTKDFFQDTTNLILLAGAYRLGKSIQSKTTIPPDLLKTKREILKIEKFNKQYPKLAWQELAYQALEEANQFKELNLFDEMISSLEKAYDCFLNSGNELKSGKIALKIAIEYIYKDLTNTSWEKVINPAQKALNHFEKIQDFEQISYAASTLAEAYYKTGRYAEAVDLYEKAYQNILKTENKSKIEQAANFKRLQGNAYLKLKEPETTSCGLAEEDPPYVKAAEAFEKAANHLLDLYSQSLEIRLLQPIAELALLEGDAWFRLEGIEAAEKALSSYAQAENIFRERDFRLNQSVESPQKSLDLENAERSKYQAALKLANALAEKAEEISNREQATELRNRAISFLKKIINRYRFTGSNLYLLTEAYLELAQTLAENGNYAEVIEPWVHAKELSSRIGMKNETTHILFRIAQLFVETSESKIYCDEVDFPSDLSEALSKESRELNLQGDIDQAVEAKTLQGDLRRVFGQVKVASELYSEALSLCKDIRIKNRYLGLKLYQIIQSINKANSLTEAPKN